MKLQETQILQTRSQVHQMITIKEEYPQLYFGVKLFDKRITTCPRELILLTENHKHQMQLLLVSVHCGWWISWQDSNTFDICAPSDGTDLESCNQAACQSDSGLCLAVHEASSPVHHNNIQEQERLCCQVLGCPSQEDMKRVENLLDGNSDIAIRII